MSCANKVCTKQLPKDGEKCLNSLQCQNNQLCHVPTQKCIDYFSLEDGEKVTDLGDREFACKSWYEFDGVCWKLKYADTKKVEKWLVKC